MFLKKVRACRVTAIHALIIFMNDKYNYLPNVLQRSRVQWDAPHEAPHNASRHSQYWTPLSASLRCFLPVPPPKYDCE